MARWIPTKRQKYGVGECPTCPAPPDPSVSESARACPAELAPLGRPVPLLLQPPSPPRWLKVPRGLGILIPYQNPNSALHTVGRAGSPPP